MPVYLANEEFSDDMLTAPDQVVMRVFLDRAHQRSDRPAKDLIAAWTEELKRKRRNLRNRRAS